jgi:hypothetical protein
MAAMSKSFGPIERPSFFSAAQLFELFAAPKSRAGAPLPELEQG